ncbi:MAG TPA: ABC transporter substrate-binding protein [Candidatus Limnocylindrales bacterium]|nr:ABC transporter substrate-binding protein [Candidatus Limnocylindrales bacterium]
MIAPILAVALILTLSFAGISSADAQRIRAASGGLSIIHSLLWVTYEQKLLKKYGLDLEYIAIENGTVGMQALLANEAQFLFSTSSLAVNANLRGSDVTVVAGGLNFIPDKLIVRPEITKPEELAGKRLAISRFGSSSETSAKLTLEKIGVKPESVSLIQLGGVSTRQVALMAGQVQATVLSDPQATAATTAGMKLWVDLSESKWGLPRICFNCFMAKRSFLDANRETASNFLKAVIEGLYLLKKDKPLGVRLIKKYLRLSDEAAAVGYDFYIGKHGEGMLSLPERRGMEFIIAEVTKTNPAASKATPESLRLLEPSFLDEIKKSGLIERVK